MSANRIAWLDPGDPPDTFPDLADALAEPDGLLAAGGDLGSARLIEAYGRGIFPWYEEGQPILWWSPDPRCVLRPHELHVSRSLRRAVRKSSFEIRCNTAFSDVIQACAELRPSQTGTWITRDMIAAFERLHAEGWAHSIEVWNGDELAGGVYGIAIGGVFFGESMFSRRTNASKFAMLALSRILSDNDFVLLDCQVVSPHLTTLGARMIPRQEFAAILATACQPEQTFENWPDTPIKVAELQAFLHNSRAL